MPKRVVDYLVEAVSVLGVRHIFGVDGANIEDLYDAVFEAGDQVTGVVAKHEFAAATMADGYARSTGGLGVVAATSGGGAMNLVPGLAESFASRVPVLALVGQTPTTLEGTGAFQDSSGYAGSIDATAVFAPVSRYCAWVRSAADLPTELSRAVAAARSGGPGVLLLPKDVQQSLLDESGVFRPEPTIARCDLAELDGVCALLRAARTSGPVVIIGGDQVAREDARDELAYLAEVLDAVVGVVPDAKDVYDHAASRFRGVAGMMGHPELIDAVRGAAACLLVGTRLPMTARAGLDSALTETEVISIGAAPPYIPATHVTTDLATALPELTAELDRQPVWPTLGRGSLATSPTSLTAPDSDGHGIRYRKLVDTITASLPPGTDVFTDAGNTGAAVIHHLRPAPGGRFIVALGMGGMGYAFGAGIGSAFARRNRSDGRIRHTVVIAGDGAFYMHGMEIHTAIEYHLPVTFIVFNNNAHAMCSTREQLFYGDRYSFNRFQPADLGAGVAAMFPTLSAYSPRTGSELAAVLTECTRQNGPSFIAVDCSPDEIPPFVPFLDRIRSRSMTTDPMPALDDIPAGALPGVVRVEDYDRDESAMIIGERVRSVYPHDEIYGEFCPVQAYIDAPAHEVYDYLADTRSLVEWTYSLRELVETQEPGLWVSYDRLGDSSRCFVRTKANPDAMTVDYHCAWDQGKHLWMIYLMRVVDAQLVLDKPGSVVLWMNCKHPFYNENPYPETAPAARDEWVGDYWGVFPAGHQLEIDNLKQICEYRASNGLPIKPDWMK